MVFAVCSPTDVIKESEVSVYDIHDHPDYKFRPGHSVIRVAGFEVRIFSFFSSFFFKYDLFLFFTICHFDHSASVCVSVCAVCMLEREREEWFAS